MPNSHPRVLSLCTLLVFIFWSRNSVASGQKPPLSQSVNTSSAGVSNPKTTDTIQVGSGQDPVPLDLNDLRKGTARVSVLNPTSVSHRFTKIRTTDFHLQDAAGHEIRNAVSVHPVDGTLPSLESLILVFAVDPKLIVSAGLYSGFVVLDDTTNGVPETIKRAAQISVPEVKPLLSSRTLWLTRNWIFAPVRRATFVVPLSDYISTNTGLRAGILQRSDHGEVVRVTPQVAGDSPVQDISYVVGDLPYAGKYDGSLHLGAAGESTVTLTVYVQDAIYWPILASALGVLVALWSKQTALLGFQGIRQIPKAPEWAKSGIAFALAIVGGLQRYYFGKPFGDSTDYISMFLVGAGAKVSLDLVIAAGRRFSRG